MSREGRSAGILPAFCKRSSASSVAFNAFATSRLLVWVVAVIAAAVGVDASGHRNEANFDVPALTHPFGGLADDLLSPLARWDSVWFLGIADHGYGGGPDTAFFPLYSLLVRAFALPFGSEGALLVAAYAVSLACFLGALAVLHRLVELELDRRVATTSVWLLALFPGAVYFGAPYSESLFLLLSVGAFYAARTERWLVAGVLAAGASATRSAGIVLLVPLALLWVGSPRRRPAELGWLALAPAGVAAYALYLGLEHGDAFAFLDAQKAWLREFAGPFVGAWDGTTAAWDGLRQLLSGSSAPVYFDRAGGDPNAAAGINVMLFAALVFAAAALAGTFRRLPFAYGAYALAALVLPLSFPVDPQPLMSLPRFVAVLFPLFVWLALVTEERRAGPYVGAASAAGLAIFTWQFASWEWIS